MPLKSQAQRAFLWATKPSLAKEFEKHTPKGKKLPQKVSTTRKKKSSRRK